MANKMMTVDETYDLFHRVLNRPAIWYSDQEKLWWMETHTPLKNIEWLRAHEDAIHVTNAYEVLDPALLDYLVQHGTFDDQMGKAS